MALNMRCDFKLAKIYNVKYLQPYATVKHGKRKSELVELTLKQVMFYKSTPCLYVFYASGKYINIKQDSVVSYEEC